MGRFSNAWTLCQVLKDGDVMEDLAKAAMRKLDIEFASIIYRYLGDVGKYCVWNNFANRIWKIMLKFLFTFLELSTKSKGHSFQM